MKTQWQHNEAQSKISCFIWNSLKILENSQQNIRDSFMFLEAYSEPCKASKIERFAKIVNGF